MMGRNKCATNGRGFTLLEVVLALAIAVIVLGLVGMAISLQSRAVDARRGEIEQAQLARAVLERIATDVRGMVRYDPQDVSDIESLAALESLSSGGEGGRAKAAEALKAIGEEDAPEQEIATSIAPPTEPGLYGDQLAMQVDVSRLPRMDQYAFADTETTATTDHLSDVKTVAYYIAPTTADSPGGLVRRELDRATARWASENNNLDSLNQNEKVLAEEVRYIEFRYHDGNQWLSEWDSEELAGLPLAVEIAIRVAPPYETSEQLDEDAQLEALERIKTYRLLVHLPDRRPSDYAEIEAAQTEGEEDSP
jgi:prepilin-type N-terminal cleavage/methylation domain-containing protein